MCVHEIVEVKNTMLINESEDFLNYMGTLAVFGLEMLELFVK